MHPKSKKPCNIQKQQLFEQLLHESCWVFSSPAGWSVPGRCSKAFTQFSILLEHKPLSQLQTYTVFIQNVIVCVRKKIIVRHKFSETKQPKMFFLLKALIDEAFNCFVKN